MQRSKSAGRISFIYVNNLLGFHPFKTKKRGGRGPDTYVECAIPTQGRRSLRARKLYMAFILLIQISELCRLGEADLHKYGIFVALA